MLFDSEGSNLGADQHAGRGRRRAGAGRGGAAFRVRGVRRARAPGARRPQSGDRGEHRRAGVALGVVPGPVNRASESASRRLQRPISSTVPCSLKHHCQSASRWDGGARKTVPNRSADPAAAGSPRFIWLPRMLEPPSRSRSRRDRPTTCRKGARYRPAVPGEVRPCRSSANSAARSSSPRARARNCHRSSNASCRARAPANTDLLPMTRTLATVWFPAESENARTCDDAKGVLRGVGRGSTSP